MIFSLNMVDYPMSHLLSGFYYYRSPSCLKVSGWGQVVAHKIFGSAPIHFGFRSYWDLAGVWPRGFGTKGFGKGLDNSDDATWCD